MSERVGVALFGLGRIGVIHLLNMLSNPRTTVCYLIERDLAKARDVVQKYHMRDTTVVGADDTSQVFADERFSVVMSAISWPSNVPQCDGIMNGSCQFSDLLMIINGRVGVVDSSVVLIVLGSFLRQSFLAFTSVTSALEGFFKRYALYKSTFYLLTYLLTYSGLTAQVD